MKKNMTWLEAMKIILQEREEGIVDEETMWFPEDETGD